MHDTQKRSEAGAVFTASRSAFLQNTAAWVPALFGVLLICCESTRRMGADHTTIWLSRLCSPLLNLATARLIELNHVLRKSGHFFGYGMLGLVFVRGWFSLLLARTKRSRSTLRLFASALGIFCVALVASMDELHQSFLPNRTACVSDVLLDTAGAVLLVSLASILFAAKRKRTLTRLLQMRTLRTWQSGPHLFKSVLLEL